MWLHKQDAGIQHIFAEKCQYIESWGPKYVGSAAIAQWFANWNQTNAVLQWDIKQFFHKENQTAAEWYFQYAMDGGAPEEFDGMSVVTWNNEGKIKHLKEFGCKLPHYEPDQTK